MIVSAQQQHPSLWTNRIGAIFTTIWTVDITWTILNNKIFINYTIVSIIENRLTGFLKHFRRDEPKLGYLMYKQSELCRIPWCSRIQCNPLCKQGILLRIELHILQRYLHLWKLDIHGKLLTIRLTGRLWEEPSPKKSHTSTQRVKSVFYFSWLWWIIDLTVHIDKKMNIC